MTDLPLPPDSDLTDAEADELLLLCGHAPGHEPLSPAAQAVLDAFRTSHTGQGCLAAALRAAVAHCTPDDSEGHWVYIPHFLKIADELEGRA